MFYDTKSLYFIIFSGDNASPAHFREELTDETTSNITLVYSSKRYEGSTYKMTVMAYVVVGIFREELATAFMEFQITKSLNGKVNVNQRSQIKNNPVLVSNENKTEIQVQLHDPLDYLKDARLVCWDLILILNMFGNYNVI